VLTIRDVSAEFLDIELTEPFGIAGGAQAAANNVLVRVTLQDGTEGIGEAAPFPAVSGETQHQAFEAVQLARDQLVGRDAGRVRQLSALLGEMTKGVPSARCALETALFDAVARRAGLSLWRLFGGAESSLVTDITIPTGDPEHARGSAAHAIFRGFETLKVKVGAGSPELDVERIRGIVASAPQCRLVLDANASLSAGAAIELTRALGPLAGRIVLFEQPTEAADPHALREVREATGLKIAADESARSAADVARIATLAAADVINIKIMKSGLGEACDMIAAARAHGLGLMIGGMVESTLAMTVSACLAAGQGGFSFVDLDTPLFMRGSPLRGGMKQEGPLIHVDHIGAGHGVRRI
jgi:o-succinylbenzoate synthase